MVRTGEVTIDSGVNPSEPGDTDNEITRYRDNAITLKKDTF